MKTKKSYSEVLKLESFEERLEYLKTRSKIGYETYGFNRFINQNFYKSKAWNDVRKKVIVRDNYNCLSHPDYPIFGNIIVHHINPISIDDIKNNSDKLYDMDNLICVDLDTHNKIHYSTKKETPLLNIERSKNDTIPWKD